MAKTIKTDDGTVLEVKEGIVLDQNNEAIYRAQKQRPNAVRIWHAGPLIGALVTIAVPFLLMAGLAVVAIAAVLILIIWTIRGAVRRVAG